MRHNVSDTERMMRIIAAAGIVMLYFGGVVEGIWGTALLVHGGIFLITGTMAIDPLYAAVGFSTRKVVVEKEIES